jgi:hypothetical protein
MNWSGSRTHATHAVRTRKHCMSSLFLGTEPLASADDDLPDQFIQASPEISLLLISP